MALLNATRNIQEKINNLYRVRANQYVVVSEITMGDIAAVTGLKNTQSGDTIIAGNDLEMFVLPTLELPEPCFMASL